MLKPVFDELARRSPEAALHRRDLRRRHRPEPARSTTEFAHPRPPGEVQAMFFGLGSDGTVGANKASVKIIGEQHRPVRPGLLRLRLEEVGLGDRVAPAVRAGADPVDLPDRRRRLRRLPPVRPAREAEGARRTPRRARRSCSTARFGAGRGVGPPAARGPASRSSTSDIAPVGHRRRRASPAKPEMGNRINTVMQPCFFQLSGVLPAGRGHRARSRQSVETTYGRAGPGDRRAQLRRHRHRARRRSQRVEVPAAATERPVDRASTVPDDAPDFVKRVTALLMARRRRPAAGERAAGRRHVPDRHDEVREAGDRQGDPDLGPRHLHRLRQVRDRLPARHDPDEGLRPATWPTPHPRTS